MTSRRAFLASPQHFVRFVYLPKYSSWLNQIETVFGIIQLKAIRRGSFTSVSDLEEKLTAFIDYYNRTLAHPFDWTCTGRCIASLQTDSARPTARRK